MLRIDSQYGEGDNFALSLEDLGKHFVMAYSVTYHRPRAVRFGIRK